ncbi:MAG: MaoC family dehydratase [Smithellaceae bacterium]
MKLKFFEDHNVGDKLSTTGRTITDTDLVLMVHLCQYAHPMFFDDEFAKATVFGKRILPGVLTLSFMQGLTERCDAWDMSGIVGMVGLNNTKFKAPVMAGDTIHVEIETIAKTETKKPTLGMVTFKQTCKNQRGEAVVEVDLILMMLRKA